MHIYLSYIFSNKSAQHMSITLRYLYMRIKNCFQTDAQPEPRNLKKMQLWGVCPLVITKKAICLGVSVLDFVETG